MITATHARFAPLVRLLAVPVMLAAAVLAAPPSRADDGDTASVRVSFADLDLNSPQGAATLYGRLETASHIVCRTYEGRGVALRTAHRRCVEVALDSAVGRVGRATLTAYHEARVNATTSHARIASTTP
jgi:UrcA family protein